MRLLGQSNGTSYQPIRFLTILPLPISGFQYRAAALALPAFLLSVILILGARRIHGWIHAGFHPEQQVTEPVRDTAVVESSSVIDSSVPTDPIATRTLGDSLDAFLEEKKTSNNYVVRHWRGELSLPVSYWINGAVLGGIVSIVLLAAASEIGNGDYSPRTILFAITGILLFSIAVWLWSVVGIWRSADHHVARGGSYVWASTARVIVVLSFIAMANDLSTNVLPQVKELALIAIGNDLLGEIVIKVFEAQQLARAEKTGSAR